MESRKPRRRLPHRYQQSYLDIHADAGESGCSRFAAPDPAGPPRRSATSFVTLLESIIPEVLFTNLCFPRSGFLEIWVESPKVRFR